MERFLIDGNTSSLASAMEATSQPIRFLALNGSPKKDGHTAQLLQTFAREAEKFGNCEVVDLIDHALPPVSGELGVPLGETTHLQQLMLEADAFVLATPTYWFNLPGQVKNFIDHLTVLEDDGWKLEGKVAGCLVYSPEGGGVNVLQNLAMVFNHMGVTVPPYGLIFDRGHGEDWVQEDIPRLAHSIAQQVRAHRQLGFHWEL
jgi:multimeric flavodoxin WrbA